MQKKNIFSFRFFYFQFYKGISSKFIRILNICYFVSMIKKCLIRSSGNIAKFDSRTNASGVSHNMSNVILLVNTLEEMSLWTESKNSDVVTAVRLRCQRHQRRLQERIGR